MSSGTPSLNRMADYIARNMLQITEELCCKAQSNIDNKTMWYMWRHVYL